MPATVKSDKWFFRATLTHVQASTMWATAQTTIKFIDMTRCLIVGHVGEKTEKEHVHGILELSKSLQKQSLDVRLKSVFGVSGADYSSKPWDGGMEHGAGSYMYHDANAVEIYCKGFTEDERSKFRECNQQVQTIVEENKSRASGRCVDRILKEIQTSNRVWTRAEIAMKILEDIKNDNMYECGDYNIRKYLEEIYMKQLSDKQWATYAQMRVSNLIRQEDVEISYAM